MHVRKWKGPKHRCAKCGTTRGKFTRIKLSRFSLDYCTKCWTEESKVIGVLKGEKR